MARCEGMSTFELYRRYTIEMCLKETLDEMVSNGALNPEIAIQVLVQFDKSMTEALKNKVKSEVSIQVGQSSHAGRSEVRMLKTSSKVPKQPALVSKVTPKRHVRSYDHQTLLKKKKLEGVATSTDKVAPSSPSARLRIPEDMLNHQCIGRSQANDLMDLDAKFSQSLNELNNKFVKINYLQEEYKRKYDLKIKEVKVLEGELTECKIVLANKVHSVSLQNQQIDRLQIDLLEAQATISQLLKDQKASLEKMAALKAKNKRSQTLIAEKAALFGFESSRVIKDFKKSIAFKIIIQDHIQEARDHIYDVEVKALEQQCIEEGFIRGFLKGVRLVQRKAGITVEGLTPSQASSDSPLYYDGDEIESELQETFTLEKDDEIVDIE